MTREGPKPTICAICNEVQRCSRLPPPTSAPKGKKVRPKIPKTAQKSLHRTKHHKPREGHKLDPEKVKHELFALPYREVRNDRGPKTWRLFQREMSLSPLSTSAPPSAPRFYSSSLDSGKDKENG